VNVALGLERPTTRLKALLARKGAAILPGTPNALFARVIEDLGFEAVYVTGAGVANMSLGVPDIGLVTLTELVDQVAAICDVVNVPVLADADTGFGNPVNMVRTVRALERAGAAGMQIEDQVFPKKCGHFQGKDVIPAAEMVQKVKAAVDSRHDGDFQIVARTDARAVEGFDEAIRRANGALQAGADVAFVEAPQTLEELADVPRRVEGPCLLNVVAAGKTPDIPLGEAAELGYRLAIVPVLLLNALLTAGDSALAELAATGRHPDGLPVVTVAQIFERAGAGRWDDVRARYGLD